MTIKAGTETITGAEVREEREMVERTPGALDLEDRPVRRLMLSGGLTDAQLSALVENDWEVDGTVHRGFSQLLRHEAVFAGRDATTEDDVAERDAVIAEVVAALPDREATRYVQYARTLKQDGTLVTAGTRIAWEGRLLRASVDLWDREDLDPAHAPTLWDAVAYHNGYRIIPETITAALQFSAGEVGYWPADGKYYRAKANGTVWTPTVYPDAWEEVAT
ncbi:MAG: hypothetical protein GXY11_07340 [Clostridiales bacterium]|nr:hypothetical protein [Clostridiales bacterium]